MKKRIRTSLILAMILCICVSVLSVEAFAAQTGTNTGQRWNIMLVVDGSKSLIDNGRGAGTDSKGLRYEAIKSFLSVLPSGNNVGAIVFGGNTGRSTDDEDMINGCILMDTVDDKHCGKLITLDDIKSGSFAYDGYNARDYIYNSIVDAGTEGTYTDANTAVMVAQEHLEKMNNGNKNAIFLFTDGLTELHTNAKAKALNENRVKATQSILNTGTKFCGVFLNDGGKIVSNEVREMVCMANGVPVSNFNLGNMYVEITDAASCSDSTDSFLKLLGFSVPEKHTFTSTMEDSFRVPGMGVEEINIRLSTAEGDGLPQMMVNIFGPDGKDYASTSLCAEGFTFQNYKIQAPDSGSWRVRVELPQGNTVRMSYAPVFSVYISSELETSPEPSRLHSNMTADVKAALTKDGNKVTDPEAYDEYKCILTMENVANGAVEEIEILPNSLKRYEDKVDLENGYGVYDVHVEFVCDDIRASSDIQTWNLENHAPDVHSFPKTVKYGLMSKKQTEIDLLDYASDMEDGKNLIFTLDSTSCNKNAIEIVGSSIYLTGSQLNDGDINILVSDTMGAGAKMTIYAQCKNTTVPVIIAIVALLIVIAIIVVIILRGRKWPDGDLSMDFVMDGKNVKLDLSLPGVSVKNGSNIYDIIQHDKVSTDYIDECCRTNGIGTDELMGKINELRDMLSDIKLSASTVREGKDKVCKIAVKWGKKNSALLYNSELSVTGIEDVDLSYYLSNSGGSEDGSWDEGYDMSGNKGENEGYWDDEESDYEPKDEKKSRKEKTFSHSTPSDNSSSDDDWDLL